MLVDHARTLLECYLWFKPCSASASVLPPFRLSPSAHNILLLCCLATITSRSILTSIVLNILYTDPAYHRKGTEKTMVQWGNALADQLMLPCRVEASPEGYHPRSSCGYEDVEKEYRQTESLALPIDSMVMRRPLKVTKVEGQSPGKTIAEREHGASKLTLASTEERIVYRKASFKAGEQRATYAESLSVSLCRYSTAALERQVRLMQLLVGAEGRVVWELVGSFVSV